jgi:tRNA-Thr(GGU) m(6)t(6)A37 methyltransferase TsaA
MKDFYPPIGVMQTCFREKFGVPRQSLLLDKAWGIIKLNPDPNFALALDQLESFSHLWILFVFHENGTAAWRPRISPPRIDSPEKVGVFASRSPHRPNPIGMSAVKLEKIDLQAKSGIEIHCSGVDILDETPVLDIKPYLPYADSIAEANSGWASGEIEKYPVSFSLGSLQFLEKKEGSKKFLALVEQVLSLDPRPTSQRKSIPIKDKNSDGKVFRFRISEYDVEWQIRESSIHVLQFIPLK